MGKSREAICNILDEALLTFEEFDDCEPSGDLGATESHTVGSSLSLNDASSSIICVEETTSAPSSVSEKVNDNPNVTEGTKKKRSWKKPKDKPKRPLSAYNLFFQYERERIIAGGNLSPEEVFAIIKAKDNRQQPKEKRRHRKTHGKISFGNLARSIGDKWKNLDKETRQVFEKEANKEKLLYKKELEEWKKKCNAKENPDSLPQDISATSEPSFFSGMMSSDNQPPVHLCNPQSLNSMMFLNRAYHSHQNQCQQDKTTSHEEMQMLHSDLCALSSMQGCQPNWAGYGFNSCSNGNHPGGYNNYSHMQDRAFGCDPTPWYMPSIIGFGCEHAHTMPQPSMDHLPKKNVGNPLQMQSTCNTSTEIHNKEFGLYHPFDEEPIQIQYQPMRCSIVDDRNEGAIIPPSFFTDGGDDGSVESFQDELSSFMKTVEHESTIPTSTSK